MIISDLIDQLREAQNRFGRIDVLNEYGQEIELEFVGFKYTGDRCESIRIIEYK